MANTFDPSELNESGEEVGFTKEQIEWLLVHFATVPHTHEIEDIDDLEEALEELGGEEEGGDEEE